MKFYSYLVIALLLFANVSCKKSLDNAVGCFGESLLMNITHTASPGNPKEISLAISYSGSFEVQSVVWEYGDGSTQTIPGNTPAVHIYTAGGAYTIKAKVSIKKAGSSCLIEPTKGITVN